MGSKIILAGLDLWFPLVSSFPPFEDLCLMSDFVIQRGDLRLRRARLGLRWHGLHFRCFMANKNRAAVACELEWCELLLTG